MIFYGSIMHRKKGAIIFNSNVYRILSVENNKGVLKRQRVFVIKSVCEPKKVLLNVQD